MLALGADEIVMHPFAEMGPIDPTVSNDFNPVDPTTQQEDWDSRNTQRHQAIIFRSVALCVSGCPNSSEPLS